MGVLACWSEHSLASLNRRQGRLHSEIGQKLAGDVLVNSRHGLTDSDCELSLASFASLASLPLDLTKRHAVTRASFHPTVDRPWAKAPLTAQSQLSPVVVFIPSRLYTRYRCIADLKAHPLVSTGATCSPLWCLFASSPTSSLWWFSYQLRMSAFCYHSSSGHSAKT